MIMFCLLMIDSPLLALFVSVAFKSITLCLYSEDTTTLV
jgi:hypothetical protein